jgi:hypothetical protein
MRGAEDFAVNRHGRSRGSSSPATASMASRPTSGPRRPMATGSGSRALAESPPSGG